MTDFYIDNIDVYIGRHKVGNKDDLPVVPTWQLIRNDKNGKEVIIEEVICKKLAEARRDHYGLMMGWDDIKLKKNTLLK